MKALSENKHKGSRKYKLNYTRLLNYDNKTGFYKSRIEISANYYKQQQQQPTSINPWKCEKCDNVFVTLKELRQHKEEYHAY
jgi:hypothetical protein